MCFDKGRFIWIGHVDEEHVEEKACFFISKGKCFS